MAMLLQPTAAFVLIIKSAAARLDARARVCIETRCDQACYWNGYVIFLLLSFPLFLFFFFLFDSSIFDKNLKTRV